MRQILDRIMYCIRTFHNLGTINFYFRRVLMPIIIVCGWCLAKQLQDDIISFISINTLQYCSSSGYLQQHCLLFWIFFMAAAPHIEHILLPILACIQAQDWYGIWCWILQYGSCMILHRSSKYAPMISSIADLYEVKHLYFYFD